MSNEPTVEQLEGDLVKHVCAVVSSASPTDTPYNDFISKLTALIVAAEARGRREQVETDAKICDDCADGFRTTNRIMREKQPDNMLARASSLDSAVTAELCATYIRAQLPDVPKCEVCGGDGYDKGPRIDGPCYKCGGTGLKGGDNE